MSITAPRNEVSDLPNDITTTATLAVGDTFQGTIDDSIDDRGDWIAVQFQAWREYVISLNGITLIDPYLELYDNSGNYVALDDDAGPGLNAEITFTPTTSGTYFLRASFYSFWNSQWQPTGDYELSFTSTDGENLIGTGGNDTLIGTTGRDTIEGFGGEREIPVFRKIFRQSEALCSCSRSPVSPRQKASALPLTAVFTAINAGFSI